MHDAYFMAKAEAFASRFSDDPKRKVGCVFVRAGEVVCAGANRLSPGVRARPGRLESPGKRVWIEHAERDAVYLAGQTGTSLAGTTCYLPWFPCADCARALIAAGVRELVAKPYGNADAEKWGFREVEDLLREGGVYVRWMNP